MGKTVDAKNKRGRERVRRFEWMRRGRASGASLPRSRLRVVDDVDGPAALAAHKWHASHFSPGKYIDPFNGKLQPVLFLCVRGHLDRQRATYASADTESQLFNGTRWRGTRRVKDEVKRRK